MPSTYEFWVDQSCQQAGISLGVAIVTGVRVLPSGKKGLVPALEQLMREEEAKLRAGETPAASVAASYRGVLDAAGQPEALASPARLLELFAQHNKLPRINSVVDAYNLVSVRTGIVLSAHDLQALKGPVRMVRVMKPTTFEPMGKDPSETMSPGEFGVFDGTDFLCRMNCRQSRHSLITAASEDVLLYAQGNPSITPDMIQQALDESVRLIIEFSGGMRQELRQRPSPEDSVTS